MVQRKSSIRKIQKFEHLRLITFEKNISEKLCNIVRKFDFATIFTKSRDQGGQFRC